MAQGGIGGGGTGQTAKTTATDGQYSTGGGGGGNSGAVGKSGGSGIVVVRYQIGELTATAKATGGAISYYNGKTIHTLQLLVLSQQHLIGLQRMLSML